MRWFLLLSSLTLLFFGVPNAFAGRNHLASAATSGSEFSLSTVLFGIGDILHSIWQYEIVSLDKQPVTVSNIIIGGLLFILGLRFSKKLSRVFRHKLLSKFQLEPGITEALEKVTYYMLLVIMTLVVMDFSNIPIKGFTFVGGALAIGVGFGSQNILNNFISGLILMVERPIKIGDFIELNNTIGRIISIGARCTHVRLGTNVDVLVPNSSLLQNQIINWTHEDARVRIGTSIIVKFGTSVEMLDKIFFEAMKANPFVLADPEPQVFFSEFTEIGLKFDLMFWYDVNSATERRRIISDVNHAIEALLRQHHISLAIPKREVAMVPSAVLFP